MNTSFFKHIAIILALALPLLACEKEVNQYEINAVHVPSEGGTKGNLKSDLQFITIMYADLFGTSISNEELKKLNQAYISFGDKNVVIDRITQHFLSDPNAQLPSELHMRTSTGVFIEESYLRFYVRKPTEAELYFLEEIINKNSTLTVRDIFYALLTSEEYKYY